MSGAPAFSRPWWMKCLLGSELVGNERRVLVSELSGQATILTKTKGLDLAGDRALMTRILGRVQDLENEGYEFEAAEASFELLALKEAGLYAPKFERLAYRVNIEAGHDGLPVTEATVKVRVNGGAMHTVSEGDGPVNALDGALRKALRAYHPRLQEMQLVDYKVRVVNARAGTAARVRVVIESRDAESVWGTVGVSENVVVTALSVTHIAAGYDVAAAEYLVLTFSHAEGETSVAIHRSALGRLETMVAAGRELLAERRRPRLVSVDGGPVKRP